ncbi:MAG: M23 family metallopeptidase [Steroidobacter sp.]
MRFREILATCVTTALWSGTACGQAGSVESLDIRVPLAPQPVRIGETTHLFYELHLTNYANSAVTLTDVAVLDANSSVLKHYRGDALTDVLDRPTSAQDAEPRSVPAGMYGVIYVTLPLEAATPANLSHRIGLSIPVRNEPRTVTLNSDVLAIDARALPELSPPLRGGLWAALYAPEMERGHRRVLYTVGGRARLPGRFAVDFVGVDAEGKTHKGSGERASDYFGYGADVLAVSDGVIAAVRDDFKDPETLAAAEHPNIGDATGAYVALDIGGGRYAFYEHLRAGVAVKVGQKVRRGERLGALGVTGQASSPHLHFHLANANAPLAAEGIPYHFTRYRVLGGYSSIMEFGKQPWQPLPAPKVISKSLPAANVVVSFD